MTQRYDVALSFAGEDRAYVEAVADGLRQSGVRVFYDAYEEASLWGKDLYVHLRSVYQDEARFTVMFISSHFAAKMWTNHERQNAQARAFSESNEYILPARFDDTEIPGILPTVAYVDLRKKTPSGLCELILGKLLLAKGTPHAGPRHRLINRDEFDRNTLEEDRSGLAVFAASAYGEKTVRAGFDPTQYTTVGALLEDLYLNYTAAYVGPLTYGEQWVARDRFVLVPWQSVLRPGYPIHEIAPEWYGTSPQQLGIAPGTQWSVPCRETFKESKWIFFGTDDALLWTIAIASMKALPVMQSHGLVHQVELNEAVGTRYQYYGVFEDLIGRGLSGAWVPTGEVVPQWLREMFKR
jgi:hypothetical protein